VQECWDQGITDLVIWATGLFVIIEQNWLFSIPDLENPPQAINLPDPHLEELPHCIAAIEPHTMSGSLEVNSYSWDPQSFL